jgi:ParB family chromosome partitioning protein
MTDQTGQNFSSPMPSADQPVENNQSASKISPTISATGQKNFTPYFNNSIFWIEVEKIKPNPYQPRREFDQAALKDLADSIRMYGLLQPLVVTRREIIKPDGGLAVEYELISGERRLRASKIAGLPQIPAIIRAGEEDARVKLELAIIENLQREDLNSVDRAYAFQRLADEFGFKHVQIAEKMGKSREYVTNTIRLLTLPKHMITALSEGKISEGHTRPLLMLTTRPEEQETLFKEITFKKLNVREAEAIARGIATERVRKKEKLNDPEIDLMVARLNESLGTRVFIEKREKGGKVVIDFFNQEDLHNILDIMSQNKKAAAVAVGAGAVSQPMNLSNDPVPQDEQVSDPLPYPMVEESPAQESVLSAEPISSAASITPVEPEKPNEDDGLYAIKNFSL